MEAVRLIVGLGNPGSEYARTRHNVGYRLVDKLAVAGRGTWRTEPALRVRLAEIERGGCRCWLAQPLTYMNCSGEAVAALVRYYRLRPDQMLVVVDDADLGLGDIRLRPHGGSGGHHGLESVTDHLGTQEYPRLRLGIGRRAEAGRQITDHVLGRFSPEETAEFEAVLARAAEAVECWASDGIAAAMNRYNGTVTVPGTKES